MNLVRRIRELLRSRGTAGAQDDKPGRPKMVPLRVQCRVARDTIQSRCEAAFAAAYGGVIHTSFTVRSGNKYDRHEEVRHEAFVLPIEVGLLKR